MLAGLCRAGAAVALLTGIAACGGDPDAPDPLTGPSLSPVPPTPAEVGAVPPPYAVLRDPVQIVKMHAAAISRRDFRAYRWLLARDFRYYLRADDVGELACGGFADSWDLGTELRLWRHMTSPHYQGEEQPVKRIDMDLRVTGMRQVGEERFEVTANAAITVLVSQDTGWLTQTAFRFDLRRQDAHLRITAIEELPVRGVDAEETTWAAIKCLYH